MALINGNNKSGKLFDVVGDDGDVLGSFDAVSDAIECGHSAPWYMGKVNIRRDVDINRSNHVRTMKLNAAARAEMDFGHI